MIIWNVCGEMCLLIKFRLAIEGHNYWRTPWLLRHSQEHSRRNAFSSMLASSLRSTYVSEKISGIQQLRLGALLSARSVDKKPRKVGKCCIVVSWILLRKNLEVHNTRNPSRRQDGRRCFVSALHCILVIWVPLFRKHLARKRVASMFDGTLDSVRHKTTIGSKQTYKIVIFVHKSHSICVHLENLRRFFSENLCVISLRVWLATSPFVNSLCI